jgi:hypothetical protein
VNATNDFEAEMAGRYGGGNGAVSEEARRFCGLNLQHLRF